MARRKNEGRTCPVLNRPLRLSTHRRSGTVAKGAKGRSACRTSARGRRSDRPPARAKAERKTAMQPPIFHRNCAAARRKSPCFFGPFGRPRIEGCSVWPNEAKCLSLQFIRSPSAQRERPNLAAHENPHHRSLRFRRFVSRRTRFGARPRSVGGPPCHQFAPLSHRSPHSLHRAQSGRRRRSAPSALGPRCRPRRVRLRDPRRRCHEGRRSRSLSAHQHGRHPAPGPHPARIRPAARALRLRLLALGHGPRGRPRAACARRSLSAHRRHRPPRTQHGLRALEARGRGSPHRCGGVGLRHPPPHRRLRPSRARLFPHGRQHSQAHRLRRGLSSATPHVHLRARPRRRLLRGALSR